MLGNLAVVGAHYYIFIKKTGRLSPSFSFVVIKI